MLRNTLMYKHGIGLLLCLTLMAVWSQQTMALEQQELVLFNGIQFQDKDSVLVVDSKDNVLFAWQAQKMLIPASLTKLATAYAAIEKWGLDYRFSTDFYRIKDTLWVKGFGDPFLVSEEIDLIVQALPTSLTSGIQQINIDNSYFNVSNVPGRTRVSDPYNAPLSAVSANFNTVNLKRDGGVLISNEPQTPLTTTAKKVAHSMQGRSERVNLINVDNAQQNFAEILAYKLGKPKLVININKPLNGCFNLGYRHVNSRTLADVLRGFLEFSNNFMANQVFLKLGDNTADRMSFDHSKALLRARLSRQFNWQGHKLEDGAGLSRNNSLSAMQISQLLQALTPHKHLLKRIKTKSMATVNAKTGTLNGVRSYAGFISLAGHEYRFVFNFNRPVPYRYRDQLLERLLSELTP